MTDIAWTGKTDRSRRPYADASRWEVVANGETYLVERTMWYAHHVWHDGQWLGMYADPDAVEEFLATLAPAQEASDADVIKAFEAKADEVAKANGWTLTRAETVMLRYLRDTSPVEAATVAAALQARPEPNRRES
ncbi:MAG: hypothetical protein LBV60_10585 [Streptomyces sp.]|jgi:hypothetical protein|nr:hypothetical protein [Streptomyces sp.]